MSTQLPLPQRNPAVSDFLSVRRSNLAKVMTDPGPSKTELDDILTTAARVPDHRKLAPWRFIVISGEGRGRLGKVLEARFQAENPGLPDERIAFEAERFLRAPVVIAVVSSPRDCPKGTPIWEQQLSAGAVCFNLLLAAQSRGYAAQWLTEWYAYDPQVLGELGLSHEEQTAGFIYLGTTDMPPSERLRPEMSLLVETY